MYSYLSSPAKWNIITIAAANEIYLSERQGLKTQILKYRRSDMASIIFDTHEFIKELKGAGFSEEQAEIITKLQKAASSSTLEQARHEYDLDNLVTNQSLDVRVKEIELKIAETKGDLIRWVVSVGLLQTTLITALLLKLITSLPA